MTKMRLINGGEDSACVSFVVTKEDILHLEETIQDMHDVGELENPEIFFRFENYPEIVALPNLKHAVYLLAKVIRYCEAHPKDKYWLDLTKRAKDGS